MTAVVSIGDVVAAKYRIDRILGVGGMGIVAAATHLELDQKVALKFMLPEAMAAPTAVERFLREARAAVRLRGEHVCRVLDVGRLDSGAPYIVMEYMAGQDFSNLLDVRTKLSVGEAVDYMLQVLEGIGEAHANGIVHRDLKPGNIFVATDTDGSPLLKVLDFGISKSSFADAATKTGDMMGSPSYMAPEQMASSKHVDARADIWALGCILYKALSGELPFTGDTLPALCMAVMCDEPAPIGKLRADVPEGLAATVMRCLAKSPDARFANVGQLAAAIAPFGSPGSEAVAVRVAKVLGRISQPMPIAVQLGATVAASDSLRMPHATPALPAELPSSSSRPPHVGQVSTLTSGAGALKSVPTPGSRRVLPLILAGVVGGGAVIAYVATTRKASDPPVAALAPPPAVAPQPSPAPPSIEPPAPRMELTVDRNVTAARAQLGSIVAAFVRWSSTHPAAPCPSDKDLASLVPGGLVDPWKQRISITCTEQPADQMMGAVSLGPDGVRSADDIASWTLGSDVTGLIQGARWTGGNEPRPGAQRPSRSTTTTKVRPTSAPTSTSQPTTATTPTSAPMPPADPPVTEPPKPRPAPTLGADGLPTGRTSK